MFAHTGVQHTTPKPHALCHAAICLPSSYRCYKGMMTPQNLQHTHDAPLPATLLYLSTPSGSYSLPHFCAFSLSPKQLLLGSYTQQRPSRPLPQRGRGEARRSPRQSAASPAAASAITAPLQPRAPRGRLTPQRRLRHEPPAHPP